MSGVITTIGKAYLLTALIDNSFSALYVGWGTGAGVSGENDTTLFSEDSSVGYSRPLATISQVTVNTTNDTLEVTGTITASTDLMITNAGMFNNPTGGILIWHCDFPPVSVSNGNTITFTYNWVL